MPAATGRRSRAGVFVSGLGVTMHPRQLPCWITHTNERTHEIIRGGLDRSPMFTGVIEGVGPRYCPSIEDKIDSFCRQAHGHQIFLEPEGPDDPRDLSEWHFDLAAVRCAAGTGAIDRRLRAARISCDPAMPSNTTISIRAVSRPRWKPKPIARSVFCRPDQRHHRLRGSRRAGAARRDQCGAASRTRTRRWCPRRDAGLSRRAGRRPDYSRVSPSPTACLPAAPSTGCNCARTTPTCD